MSIPNDIIYVLSATYNGPNAGDDGNMYLGERYEQQILGNTDTIAMSIENAKVFYSKQEAWNYREDAPSSGWQITPISAKVLFTKKLKSK